MKFILSRKGFDSAAGGVPSPIFPDAHMLSLPIPDKHSPVTYNDLEYWDGKLGPLVENLTSKLKPEKRIFQNYHAHLDPDIVRDRIPRQQGWRPLFGQADAAQAHLRKNKVGVGDLFLFFGLYRQVEKVDGAWRYIRNAKRLHVLWGWFQIKEVLHPNDGVPAGYPWAKDHPHFQPIFLKDHKGSNVVYVARQHLQLPDHETSLPGAGVFHQFSPDLQLTAPEENTSVWNLPRWFYPTEGRTSLTYHDRDLTRWQPVDELTTRLKTVGRGQEFVLDGDQYPEASNWAFDIIQKHGMNC